MSGFIADEVKAVVVPAAAPAAAGPARDEAAERAMERQRLRAWKAEHEARLARVRAD